MVNNPDMPNPFLIIFMFAFALAIVRAFTTTVHELGHALVGMILFKGDIDIYIGTYGDSEKGMHFKIGRLKFHFVYAPFSLAEGVVMHSKQNTTYLRDFMVTLAGPVASLLAALVCIYVAVFANLDEVVKIVFYILAASAFRDFWTNIKVQKDPIILLNGRVAYNDGYNLRNSWSYIVNGKTLATMHELYEKELFKEGAEYFEKIYKRNKGINIVRMGIAFYYHLKELERGFDLLKRLENKNKMDSNDYCTYGLYYAAMEDYFNAIKQYSRSVELNPANTISFNNRGYTHNLLSQFKEAINDFDTCLLFDPESAFPLNNRGYAKIKLNDLEGAFEDINKSLELDSENAYAYRNLGMYYSEKGDYVKALELYEKAKGLDDETPELEDLIADAGLKVNRV